jgi:hypothetical protein
MQMKVELSQIRTLGEIIDDSILFFKQNYKALLKSYFVICGFFWVAGLIIAVLNQTQKFQLQDAGESFFTLTFFLTALFNFINFVFILITVLSFIALYKEKGNNAPAVDEVWGYVKYYILRVFGSSIVLVSLLAAGVLLCVLPGIYLMPVFLLILTIMILENASFGYAFRSAFKLIKENWWHTIGVLMVMAIIVIASFVLLIIPVVIIVVGILYLTTANRAQTSSLAITITVNGLQFLYMFPIIAMALVYFNLNEQKDDYSLMQRIAMVGKNNTELNQLPEEEY